MAKKPKTIKVLLVEDNLGDARLFQERLKETEGRKRYKVITAETGEEGVKKARAEKPNLLIIDTLLPGIDGFQACRKIKKIKGLRAKLIIYTGVIDAVDARKARAAGADDYVVKTVDFSPLMEAMKKLI